eukprot:200867-Rhodomonas_salina.2
MLLAGLGIDSSLSASHLLYWLRRSGLDGLGVRVRPSTRLDAVGQPRDFAEPSLNVNEIRKAANAGMEGLGNGSCYRWPTTDRQDIESKDTLPRVTMRRDPRDLWRGGEERCVEVWGGVAVLPRHRLTSVAADRQGCRY